MLSPTLMEERGIFVFDPSAVQEISTWFDSLPAAEITRELVCLTAAELAVMRFASYPGSVLPLNKPVLVTHEEALLALLKTDCNPIVCISGADERPLTLNDITAFSSDVAKLAALGLSIEEPPDEIGEIARAVDELERMHRAAPPGRAQVFADSGVLRLQGFLWSVKLSLPRGDLDQAVDDAYEALELSRPVGGTLAATPA